MWDCLLLKLFLHCAGSVWLFPGLLLSLASIYGDKCASPWLDKATYPALGNTLLKTPQGISRSKPHPSKHNQISSLTCPEKESIIYLRELPRRLSKESADQCRRQEIWFSPWVGKIPWRRKWQTTPVFLPGELHRQWILVGYCLYGRKELDMTEKLSMHVYICHSWILANS